MEKDSWTNVASLDCAFASKRASTTPAARVSLRANCPHQQKNETLLRLALLLVRVKGLEQLHKHRVECNTKFNLLFAVLRSIFCEQNMRVKNHQLYQTNRKGIRIAYPFSIGAGKRTWTFTKLPPLEPESSASANSAIPANILSSIDDLYIIHDGDCFVNSFQEKNFRKILIFFEKTLDILKK